ncbi:polysaccharide pyruvyl transferase family protein [Roseinatronobacter sp. S2]|uniref:polysaccharide pyruvyl transferase family protein n=1 Tax=Roseinatronobacter sp. S2 TaxID=3035471 RepID=UPI00240FEB37|nr:polysaccharide pyruvyl transferase family protein [Roseinatronobacter sp. S2]WFE75344.1 polysaccharide pyruvyl transferase family protein [Roseinatronobacter sp. S2]
MKSRRDQTLGPLEHIMSKTKKRVFILGHLGFRNFGDELMLQGFFDGIGSLREAIEWSFLVPKGSENFKDYSGSQVPSDVSSIMAELRCCDAVVIMGGTSFHDNYPFKRVIRYWINLAAYVFIAKICQWRRKPFLMIGVGFGPARYGLTRFFIKKIIGASNQIVVRDSTSENLLKSLKIDESKYTRGQDLALLFGQDAADVRPKEKKIVVNFIDEPCLKESDAPWHQKTIECLCVALEKFFQTHPDHELHLLPLGMGRSDRDEVALATIHERLRSTTNIKIVLHPFSAVPDTAISTLKECAAFITSRYHGAVAGYALSVPTFHVCYHPKVDTFAQDIGASDDYVLTPAMHPSADQFSQFLHDATTDTFRHPTLDVVTARKAALQSVSTFKQEVLP